MSASTTKFMRVDSLSKLLIASLIPLHTHWIYEYLLRVIVSNNNTVYVSEPTLQR
uniref:Uncharacterized protein n=1 Tax=uncultured bacterium A1Q1_fos_2004 TaxID=1256557 RepID=L7VT92_9BACT|nr:hypothetical protein [uncultured bacterium A1Q1_fos_2004]